MKREHLNEWSPWQTSTFPLTSRTIEIREEMSLFAELKTFTEKARERCCRVPMEGRRLEARGSV